MEQINFRVEAEEKEIIKKIAKIKGMSITELVKKGTLEYIRKERVELAFKLLKEGKIGRKKTWTLSGLSSKEFLDEWEKRGAEEEISETLLHKIEENAKLFDFSPSNYRKKTKKSKEKQLKTNNS